MTSTISYIAMIGGLSTPELLLIVFAIVLLFGLGKLPQAAKQLGLGVRNFQKSVRGEEEDEEGEDPKKLEESKTTTIPSKEKNTEHAS